MKILSDKPWKLCKIWNTPCKEEMTSINRRALEEITLKNLLNLKNLENRIGKDKKKMMKMMRKRMTKMKIDLMTKMMILITMKI